MRATEMRVCDTPRTCLCRGTSARHVSRRSSTTRKRSSSSRSSKPSTATSCGRCGVPTDAIVSLAAVGLRREINDVELLGQSANSHFGKTVRGPASRLRRSSRRTRDTSSTSSRDGAPSMLSDARFGACAGQTSSWPSRSLGKRRFRSSGDDCGETHSHGRIKRNLTLPRGPEPVRAHPAPRLRRAAVVDRRALRRDTSRARRGTRDGVPRGVPARGNGCRP